MRTNEELEAVSKMSELLDAHLFDFIGHIHIVIGPNGRCMCGTYGARAMTCEEILALHSHDIQDAIIAGSFAGKPFYPLTDESESSPIA